MSFGFYCLADIIALKMQQSCIIFVEMQLNDKAGGAEHRNIYFLGKIIKISFFI